MHRRAVVHALGALAVTAALGACGASDAASPEPPSTVGDVGLLPGTIAGTPTVPSTVPSTEPSDSTNLGPTATDPTGSDPGPEPVNDGRRTVGRLVDGNRVIVIGDSILASISNRYGNQLCEELVPRGWMVEVDAEVGRFIRFGREVLAVQRPEEWDAAVIMLGNNYDGDPQAFTRELGLLLDELEPLPVLLLNVTRFEPAQDEVNWILTVVANERDDVALLDWASPTADDAPASDELLTGDGLHLTTQGQEALATLISRAMGRAPAGSDGECLRSSFRDDSDGAMPPAPERSNDDDNGDDETDDGGDDTRSSGRVGTTTTPRAPAEPPGTVNAPAPTAPADQPEATNPSATGET